MVTVASAPPSGGVLRTLIPRPLPIVTYQVSGSSPVISWATEKAWRRDHAAGMT